MGRRWKWIIIVLSILIFAFLFPYLMLRIMEKDMESKVLSYGTGTLLNFDSLTLSEKQVLLARSDITIIDENISDSEVEGIQSTLEEELQFLADCGGISSQAREYIWEALTSGNIHSRKAYDPGAENLVYFYAIESDRSFVHLDRDSGKILALGVRENADTSFSPSDYDSALRSWAEYFSMSVSDLIIYTEEHETDLEALCKFTGSADTAFYYGIYYDSDTDLWKFSSVKESISENHS